MLQNDRQDLYRSRVVVSAVDLQGKAVGSSDDVFPKLACLGRLDHIVDQLSGIAHGFLLQPEERFAQSLPHARTDEVCAIAISRWQTAHEIPTPEARTQILRHKYTHKCA